MVPPFQVREAIKPDESQAAGCRGFHGSWKRQETEANQASDVREWELGKAISREQKLIDWKKTEGECIEGRVTAVRPCDPRGDPPQQNDILGLK